MSAEYIPGSCNIGQSEVRRRWILGWAGLITTVVAAAILIVTKADPLLRLLLLFPAELSALGFLQAAWHFCVAYGLLGVFNVGPDLGKTDTIEQAQARAQDRLRATQIILLSTIIGVAVGVGAYLLPM
ncbi:hypothetical protein SH661x_003245 [Planctomicrobium sp. SH661]|uniref:hypothetical protein n=1 Tax=Planctomicrobium sp. SH661 TaxID=3448124 RepID=UPI003F5B0032